MGENLLNHCLVRYTEPSITTQFRMYNNQILNLQGIQFSYVRKSHETMFRRDILNLKLSSEFDQSTISFTTQSEVTINNKVITILSIKLWAKIS